MVGAHRDPLMTSLELDRYARWLNQRKILGSGSKFNWTWIQTHMPEWQVRLLYDRPIADDFPEPIGPQPEQIRLLTYIAIANGCKGLGFWTDRFLADSRQGRDRLLQMALLNQEIEMLEPLLMDTTGEIRWIQSSHPSIKVALLRTTGKGLLALPIWLGSGAQYVPPQGAVQGLKFSIPVVPDGMEPWEITPVRVQSLQNQMKLTPEGTEITLNEFDLTAAIVFTSDIEPDGLLAAWQKYTKRAGKFAASWACDLAEEQMKKVLVTHKRLEQVAPPVYDARRLIHEAEKQLVDARRSQAANNDEDAYMSAIRTMRPLRLLMRAHWDRAVKSLSHPAATPYSVSFHTLPRHWELAKTIAASTLGENELRDGDFNSLRPADARGVAVTTLPGWTVQEVALDDVIMIARIVNSAEAKTPEPVIEEKKPPPYSPTSPLKRVVDPQPRQPPLGAGVLRLTVTPRPLVLKKDEKAPPEPQSLERVFLAVNSPPVKFAPGTWVRISGWMKVPAGVRASADGAMFFDTATGEAYAVRVNETLAWKQFFFYRKVPASGEIRVRMAMTGFGTVYFDDIRVEPFVPGDGNVPLSPLRGEGLRGEGFAAATADLSPQPPLRSGEGEPERSRIGFASYTITMIARGIAQLLVRDGSVLAQSDDFNEDWRADIDRVIDGFGLPAGAAAPDCLFAVPLTRRHVVVASVSGRKFRLLILSRALFNAIPDPFAIASRFPPSWDATGTLPAIEWPLEPLPPRTVAMLDTIFKQGDGPFLYGGCQTLVDSGRIALVRDKPALELCRDLWALLPDSTRRQTWLATYAYAMTLSFGLVVLPMLPEGGIPGYLNEDQTRDYPESRYERELQYAVEHNDQRDGRSAARPPNKRGDIATGAVDRTGGGGAVDRDADHHGAVETLCRDEV